VLLVLGVEIHIAVVVEGTLSKSEVETKEKER
jgi:hypothetical protein